jgi:sigma-54 dependent transcriptional regulator, acetoin dehydrogenase operon transcriptional activator AcoR
MGRAGLVLSDAALAALVAHPWLGNVRELKNVMMRAAAVVTTPAIEPVHLRLAPVRVGAPARSDAAPAAHERQPEPPAVDSRQSERPPLDERGADPRAAQEADGPERDELVAALDACGWNIARTATSLGVSRMTLYRRLRKFGITR